MFFWAEFSSLLFFLDRKAALESNNSTVLDTLGGEGSIMDDIFCEVFPEQENVRDSFLIFEVPARI